MAIYEFICHNCEVIWEREAPMSKAPSRSRCPECKKLSNRHWGDVPLMFNGSDYYTNTRKQFNLVHRDKAKAKEVQEQLLDASKKMAEEKKTPYKEITLTEKGIQKLGLTKKSDQQLKDTQKIYDEVKSSVYNNSQAYRNLGKR